MSQLAEAEPQMKNTRLEATALLAHFGSQDMDYPTDVCVVGRDTKGIGLSNTEFSFKPCHEMRTARTPPRSPASAGVSIFLHDKQDSSGSICWEEED